VIKRYSNRKLYDIQDSRYVTLEELEEMIRAGREISVVDAATGEDLTSVTLAQIILESERNRRAALPTGFLHQLIKHGEAWQEFVQKSLRSSLEGVITSQREADRVFREWAARAGLIPPRERSPRGEKGQEPAPEGESLRDEVAALKEKLKALEARLERKRGR
ncbi:MAG: polyhydroxyalkanoate synthesis regulator DNA-binding domain-containing protein, partial [Candidatus Rokubacteria bacterium]|nr:polyhydroxyalkanoate synthesis regulator DNA-binding domain-containing protein [Candidatus Rokubacteria bacterium]